MKAISLHQPYASALFIDIEPGVPLKPDETRHWQIPAALIGETIAIHAAKRDTWDLATRWVQYRINMRPSDPPPDPKSREVAIKVREAVQEFNRLPFGQMIGTLRITECVPTEEVPKRLVRSQTQLDWGGYGPNRYAWVTADRRLFATPIPCVGRQGFFNWTPPAEEPISL